MKKLILLKPTYLFWMVLVLPLLGACEKEDGSNVIFKLVVYNESGIETNSLNEGEDFSISLESINRTNQIVHVSQSDWQEVIMQLHPHPDCLMIYQEITDDTGKVQRVPVGKPYDPTLGINFPDIYMPPRAVNPGEFMYGFSGSWSDNSENQPIEKGKYFSFFKGNITLNNRNIHIDTEIAFEVN